MKILRAASAGTMESSDAYVEIEPGTDGVKIQLESVVGGQFGDAIETVICEVLKENGRLATVEKEVNLVHEIGSVISTLEAESGKQVFIAVEPFRKFNGRFFVPNPLDQCFFFFKIHFRVF